MASGNIKDIIDDSSVTDFKTGQWYGVRCSKNLKAYADKTHVPVFIVRSGPACPNCDDFMANTLKKQSNFDQISKENAIFLYYSDNGGEDAVSHVMGTDNDTKNLGKYSDPINYARDFRTYSPENGKFFLHYYDPWPIITGYHNLGDGTAIMSIGTISEGTYLLKNIRRNTTPFTSNTTDIGYYLKQFEEQFQVTQTPKTYSVTFYDYNRTVLKEPQQVIANMDAVPPDDPYRENHTFTGWDPSHLNVIQDLSCVAQYKMADMQNPITRNHCFGLRGDCTITTGDGIRFKYDYKTNSLRLSDGK